MAFTFLTPGLRLSLLLSTPLICATPLLIRTYARPIRCDAPAVWGGSPSDLKNSYARDVKTPIIKQSGAPNPQAIKQISLGSILGVLGGLGVSVFSKPLAVLIGLGVVVLQLLESRGFHLIPYAFIQRRITNTNVKSLILDNVAFKLSFGLTFALAAFAEL